MRIKDFTSYFKNDIKNAIDEISEVFIVANESQLSDKIKSITKSQIFLVVIVPSADINAESVDDIKKNNSCLLYVLKFYNSKDKTSTDFENAMEETQDVLVAIEDKMTDDVNTAAHGNCPHIMHYFDPNNMHEDPEYNFLGCNGWSLSFNLTTPGF